MIDAEMWRRDEMAKYGCTVPASHDTIEFPTHEIGVLHLSRRPPQARAFKPVIATQRLCSLGCCEASSMSGEVGPPETAQAFVVGWQLLFLR